MLEHLSPKFKMPFMEREPRAALILNRFTRSLTIMFATNAITQILGVSPDDIKDKSFYDCIQRNCLNEAARCLESAKANDSIAYLRFWRKDPRSFDDLENTADEDDDGEEGGNEHDEISNSERLDGGATLDAMDVDEAKTEDVAYSHGGTVPSFNAAEERPARSRASRSTTDARTSQRREPTGPVELEAVVSCTSDGLVVVLRKARPPIPAAHPPVSKPFEYKNGLFAAPWAQQPIQPHYSPDMPYTFQPPLLPQFMPLRENVNVAGGPLLDQVMGSIRDVAVFAWALVGINGNLVTYARGLPGGEAQPRDGLPPVQGPAPRHLAAPAGLYLSESEFHAQAQAQARAIATTPESENPQSWAAPSSIVRDTSQSKVPLPTHASTMASPCLSQSPNNPRPTFSRNWSWSPSMPSTPSSSSPFPSTSCEQSVQPAVPTLGHVHVPAEASKSRVRALNNPSSITQPNASEMRLQTFNTRKQVLPPQHRNSDDVQESE